MMEGKRSERMLRFGDRLVQFWGRFRSQRVTRAFDRFRREKKRTVQELLEFLRCNSRAGELVWFELQSRELTLAEVIEFISLAEKTPKAVHRAFFWQLQMLPAEGSYSKTEVEFRLRALSTGVMEPDASDFDRQATALVEIAKELTEEKAPG